MEQLDYNLLFRWFVGLGVDDPVWDVTVFTKNRDRLLEGEIAAKFLRAVLAQPKVKALLVGRAFLGRRHADPGLGVSMKSFRPKDGSGEPPAPGPQRRARLPRRAADQRHATPRPPTPRPGCSARAKARRPSSASWAMLLMENRHGLIVDGRVSEANGTAERDVAQAMVAAMPGRHRITVGGDKNFDTAGFVAALQRAQRDAARRPEHQQPPLGDRRPDHPPSRLRGEPAHPQADRGGVRLDQGGRPAAARPASRQGAGRLAVHPGGRGLQPDPAAQAAGGRHETEELAEGPRHHGGTGRCARRNRRRPTGQASPSCHKPTTPEPPKTDRNGDISSYFQYGLRGRR